MKTIVPILVVLLLFQTSVAQSVTPQVINSTGGTQKQRYYTLEWSVGELALVDLFKPSETTYIITNGFLQSYTDSPERTASAVASFNRDEIIILPNPTTSGRLEVNFFIQEKGEVRLTLYDAVGGNLETRRVILYGFGKFERFNLVGLPGSTYLLAIEFVSSTGEIKKKGSYKIVKIQ